MKEFNLNHALNGLPVVTRDGNIAMFVCTINNELNGTFYFWKIFEDNSECLVKTDLTGKAMPGNMLDTQHLSYHDLFMAPVKRQEWVNIHYALSHIFPYGQYYHMPYNLTFESEEKAMDYVAQNGIPNHMKTVLIREWEE